MRIARIRRYLTIILTVFALSACSGSPLSSVESSSTNSSSVSSGDVSSESSSSSFSYSSEPSSAHSHEASEEYFYDETNHWHYCTGCAEKLDVEQHQFEKEVIEPTFSEEGYTVYRCTKCRYSYRDIFTPCLEHHFGEQWYIDENRGTHYHLCTDPGFENLRGDEEPHRFSDHVIAPTYTTQGYTEHVCDVCGFTYSDTYVNPLEHNYSSSWSYDEEQGTHYHACVDVGYEGLREDEAPHVFESHVHESIYEEDGYTEHACSVCGYSYQDDFVPRLDHHYSDAWSIDEEQGTHYHACIDAGYEDYRSSEAPHRYGEWTVIKESTVEERGLRMHACSVCGYEESEETPSISELSAQFMVFSWNEETDSYSVSSYWGTLDVVVIPAQYQGYPVTRIDEEVFAASNVESVLLSDALQEIGAGCFLGCSNLKQIVFGSGLVSIGANAFAFSGLKDIAIPDSVDYIGFGVFLGCELISLSVPFLGESFGDSMPLSYFFGSKKPEDASDFVPSSLKSVTLLEGIVFLPDYAFYDCAYLTHVRLPESLISIGAHAFENCRALFQIELPENLDYIGEQAFYGCQTLVEIINLSSLELTLGSEEYGYVAYYAKSIVSSVGEFNITSDEQCTLLHGEDHLILISWFGEETEAVVPEGVTDIGAFAFYENKEIVSISLPSSLQTIGNNAFASCISLTEVSIPSGVTEIGSSAFELCSSLVSVTLPDNLETLSSSLFSNCISLRYVHLPARLQSIGDDCFAFTSSLKGLALPEGLLSLGTRAFYHSALESIELPSGLRSIGYCCFGRMESLSSISIPNSVTTMGALTFTGCSSLLQAQLPSGLTTIGESMFEGCSSLRSVELPSALSAIEEEAFRDCGNLLSLTLPAGLSSIGKDAFTHCGRLSVILNYSSLPLEVGSEDYGGVALGVAEVLGSGEVPSLTIKNGFATYEKNGDLILCGYVGKETNIRVDLPISSVKPYAFARTSLQSIILPEGITYIGDYAFMNSFNLETASLPDSLESVGYRIFAMEGTFVHSALVFHHENGGKYIGNETNPYVLFYGPEEKDCERFEVHSGCRIMYSGAFSHCSNLSSLTLPNTLRHIGRGAFAQCANLKELVIPNSVTSIEQSILRGCASLEKLSVPFLGHSVDEPAPARYFFNDDINNSYGLVDSLKQMWITMPISELADGAFSHAYCIEEVHLPSSIRSIGDEAFIQCEQLKSIELPEGLLYIGEGAFYSSGIQSISVPASVISIGYQAFFSGVSTLSLPFVGGSRDANQTMDYVLSPYGFYEEITITECLPIAERAFAGFFNLKHVTFLEGASSIGERAFVDCSSLESIDLSKCGGAWGESAFASCGALKTVVLPDDLAELPDRFFSACPIEEMNLPSSLKRLGDGAISGNRLTDIVFPPSLEYIGAYNFRGKSFASLTLPSSLAHIGERAFAECGIENLTILSSNIVIESEAFYRNPIISIFAPASVFVHGWASNWFGQSLTYWPSTLSIHVTGGEKILEEAFLGMNVLREITLCDGLSVIETNAFYGCAFLAEIELPDSLCRIESGAFAYCRSLLELHIPEAVSTISSGILTNCTNVRALTLPYLDGTLNDLFGIQYEDDTRYFRLERLFIMNSNIGDRALYQWVSLCEVKLGNVSSIGEEAFYGCRNLKQIELPSSLQQIGDDAFYGCVLLLEIINKSPLNLELGSQSYGCIAEHARAIIVDASQTHLELLEQCYLYADETGVYFAGCLSNVYDLVIPSNVTSILPYACAYATSLHNVTVGENVRSIGERAFYGSSINNILLPDGLISLGEEAFGECANLIFNESRNLAYLGGASNPYVVAMKLTNPNIAVLVVEEGCKIIASRVLSNSNIQQVILPEGLIRIEAEAFAGCSLLEEVTIPSSVLHIDERAFVYCKNLKSLSLPFLGSDREHPLTLDYLLGENVGLLESITIEYVPYLPEKAFYMCFNLVHVTIGSELSVIPDYAFYECRKLQDGVLIAHATSIGDYAFFNCRNLYRPVFSEGLTSIGDFAFCNDMCVGIIEIPSTLVSIGEDAFNGAKIYGVINHSTLPIEKESSDYGCVALDAYAVAPSYNELQTLGLIEIEDFYTYHGSLVGYVGLAKEVEVPLVFSIDYYVFSNCDTLEKVYFQEGIEKLPSYTSIGLSYDCFTKYESGYYIGTKNNPLAYLLGIYDKSVTSVSIPDGCTMFSDYAFQSCRSLVSLQIPSTVKVIGDCCFQWCVSLQNLDIPSSVYSIGQNALNGCKGLQSLTLPFLGGSADEQTTLEYFLPTPHIHDYQISTITLLTGSALADSAFKGFSSLQNVLLPEGFETIGESAFEGTGISSFDMPSSLISIGARAFAYTAITEFNVPESVTYIGPDVLKETHVIDLALPSMEGYINGTRLLPYLGLDGRAVHQICFLEGWRTIPASLCESAKVDIVILPKNLTSIGNNAFSSSALYSVTLPRDLDISNLASAFRNCSYLTEILNQTRYSDAAVAAKMGRVGAYIFVLPSIEKSHITIDEDYVWFEYENELRVVRYLGNDSEINLPEGVTSIGRRAFLQKNIVNVTLPGTLREIGDYAFAYCNKLEYISIPDSLERLGRSVFDSCSVLMDSASIGALHFLGCEENHYVVLYKVDNQTIESAVIPSSCRVIAQYAFKGCAALWDVRFNSDLREIGPSAFNGCNSLVSVSLPEGLLYLGENAFDNCSSLQWNVLDGIRYLGNKDCSYLVACGYVESPTSIVFSEQCVLIADFAFFDCTSITSVMFQNSALRIGDFAFYGCTSLSIIHYGDGVAYIGKNAFPA